MSTYNNQTGRLSPQTLLQQRYLIIGAAGRGGMGAVYEGIDTRLAQKRVAIKEMSQAHFNDEELAAATARFQHEARMLGSLSHPNLPHIIDAFSENERSYLVMDFIEGKTLYQLLKEAQGRPLPLAQVVHYALQMCSVLAYLHQHHPPIIFRDIKPTNIMITSTGHLFLIDFGIARFFKEGQEQDTMLLGSPGYAPPEQHGSAQTSPRSDIYSLGATLHFCLTGQDPYYTKTRFIFAPISQYNPTLPVELDLLIQRMIAQDERARPASMLEVRQSLAKISQQAEEQTHGLDSTTPPTHYMQTQPGVSTHLPGTSKVDAQAPTVAVNAPAPLTNTAPAPVRSSSPWKAGFFVLLGSILIMTLGSSAYVLNIFHPYYGGSLVAESIFALLLVLITCFADVISRDTLPRLISLCSALAALIASATFAVAGWGDLQIWLFGSLRNAVAYTATFNLLFTSSLAIVTILSLYWLVRPFAVVQRILLFLLFGLALGCILVQATMPLEVITKHLLLLLALIVLICGVLLVAQLERVQKKLDVAIKRI